jgi:hypothetical protein
MRGSAAWPNLNKRGVEEIAVKIGACGSLGLLPRNHGPELLFQVPKKTLIERTHGSM